MREEAWMDALIRQAADPEQKSPELRWLADRFEDVGRNLSITRKGEIDELVLRRLQSEAPCTKTQVLKVRYWRTGRHKPKNRAECLHLGQVLELDDEQMLYLIQHYYDSADMIFDKSDRDHPLYQERVRVFEDLEKQYLMNAYPDLLEQMGIPWDKPMPYLRHYYFHDAAGYVSGALQHDEKNHAASANYVLEFQKNRHLIGEIPRQTMIRHLFIMGAPFLSVQVMNDRLSQLGYMQLEAEHENRYGARTDFVVLRLLEVYEEACRGKTPSACLLWLKSSCKALDKKMVETGHQELRFLTFKALKAK